MGEKRKRSDDSCSEAEVAVGHLGETPEKRQKVGSVEPCTPQPLTRKNLALLEGKMPAKPETEDGGASSSKTPKTKSSGSDHGKQVEVLRYNGMNFIDEDALDSKLGTEIMNAAKDVVAVARHSAMPKEKVNQFLKKRRSRQFANEDTFVDVMWRILVDESRSVKVPSTEDLENDDEWIIIEWDDSGLRHSRNQRFKSQSVPVKDTKGQKDLEKYLCKIDKVPTPQPDLAYGLGRQLFTDRERSVNLQLDGIANISGDIYYPFFVVEFKSAKSDFQAAEVQACRGGAALLYSMRRLREAAGLSNNNEEEDVGRMAFSMAMNPYHADISVHWAQKPKKGQVTYEMARVDGFDLQKREEIPKLRSHINNILDWGTLKRLTYIKLMLSKIRPIDEESSEEEDEDSEDPLSGR